MIKKYNNLSYNLNNRYDAQIQFNKDQINMTADLNDNTSFQGMFDKLTRYAKIFSAIVSGFALLIIS